MADSLILVLQSIIAGQAAAEFQPSFHYGLTFAAYAGMLVRDSPNAIEISCHNFVL